MTRSRLAICFTLFVAMIASAGRAAPVDPRRDQVAAANARALEGLRTQIFAEPIAPGITVKNLLDKTSSTKSFLKTLARAQQLGGPRWVDETCQVRLEIAGSRVARALVDIATLDRIESPIAPEVLAIKLRDWDQRTFAATGTSAGAAIVEQIPDQKVRAACAAARKDAVARVIQSTSTIPLAGGKTVGDAMANPAVHEDIENWLASRPITQVDFPDQNQARVTLAAPGDEFFDAFHASVVKQKDVAQPGDEKEWARIREEFITRAPAGRGVAKMNGGNVNAVAAPPIATPAWADSQIDAQGSGTATGSPLKAARAAEADAATKLRVKLDPLPLMQGKTIGQAVAQDKSIENAVDRALSHARTTRTEYQPDGSARVTVQLDLHDVWDELSPQR